MRYSTFPDSPDRNSLARVFDRCPRLLVSRVLPYANRQLTDLLELSVDLLQSETWSISYTRPTSASHLSSSLTVPEVGFEWFVSHLTKHPLSGNNGRRAVLPSHCLGESPFIIRHDELQESRGICLRFAIHGPGIDGLFIGIG